MGDLWLQLLARTRTIAIGSTATSALRRHEDLVGFEALIAHARRPRPARRCGGVVLG
jgi:hypothetical protein